MEYTKLVSKTRHKTNKKTERSRFTRMCIGESIIELMDVHGLERLSISSIAKKAGVSRMTFYYYYNSIQDALVDYTKEIAFTYLQKRKETPGLGKFQEYSHLLFSLKFFDQYEKFFLTMAKNRMHSILLDGINRFMVTFCRKEENLSLYDIYFYAGGLLNIFIKWEENGKKESVEEIARIISSHA